MTKKSLLFLLFTILNIIFQIQSKEEIQEIRTVEELEELINSTEFKELEEDQKLVNLMFPLFSGDECLVSKNEAKTILKNEYGITNNSPDKNLRFILGKCNPVLLIPGIYASKIIVELNCLGLSRYEKDTTLKDLRVFCGDSLCKDETITSEEHPLFVALLDKAFSILGGVNDKYSSCLGFIMNFFQNENECPTNTKTNNKKICYKSDYIKVGFYGGSPDTVNDSKCGVEGVQKVIQSGNKIIDGIVNMGAAKSFETMSKKLIKRGYAEGFSLGGLPNDYRRFLATNNFANEVFRSQINRLYANTGKPVVIVGHSYGTLLTLSNLVNKKNQDLLPKIKKFIAVAPPFAGSSKLLDIFLHGMNDWNKSFDILGKKITITNYNIFGQFMMYNSMPTLTELRPLSITGKLFTNTYYRDLADAIRERLALENKCRSTDCSSSYIKSSSTKFDSLFKGYFPSLTEKDCAYESKIDGNQDTFNRKCYTELYNVGDCPSILTKTSSFNPSVNNVENYCNKSGSQFYYQKECNNNADNKQCLDEIYYTKGPYVYNNKEAVNYLIKRFNDNYSSKYGKIDMNYFDSLTHIREGHKNLIDYHTKISQTKDLPPPPVDTDIIYASFAKTPGALILDSNDFSKSGEIFKKSGDDTVPTWSSMLTGMKWIFDKKKQGLKQKYKLVEYCSRLSNTQYNLDPNKEQNFIALGCSCLNSKNVYKNKYSDCTHAAMINDDNIIEYVLSVVDDPKEKNIATKDKKNAVNIYDSTKNYERLCNYDLKNIFDTAK